MDKLKYNNKTYINGEIILKNAPIYSKGCRSVRDLVKKKKITDTDFIYARLKDNEWNKTEGKSAKFDKVFLLKSIIDSISELNNNETITDDKGIEKAPGLIHLKDEEKFQDNEGNILDIETRGERNVDKIYFKVKDVSKTFNIESLYRHIIDDERKSYIENEEYKYFICEKTGNWEKKSTKKSNNKTTIKKELFLTYQGMLRVLFVSRNNKTSKFIKWATKTLFTTQMGTDEQKNKLVSQIKGVSYESIQELFSINARELPCVYLTAFNTVNKLRKEMDIGKEHSDDSIVYKFGLTKSFETRKNGHNSEYKKLDNLIEKKLVYFSYIDPLYISEAEMEIKNLLSDYKIEWDNHDELVVIPNNMLKFVKKIYENIGMKYSGHTAEFNKKINDLNMEILKKDKDHEIELLKKDNKIQALEKDNEILQLKLLLAQKNN
jgi:hypothetical protein